MQKSQFTLPSGSFPCLLPVVPGRNRNAGRPEKRTVFSPTPLFVLGGLLILSLASSSSWAGGPQESRRAAAAREKSYSLTPRFRVGQKSAYRFVNRQFILSEGQGVVARVELSGDFERAVVEVKADGSAVERVTWRDFSSAFGQGRSGPLAKPEQPPWAKGFSYLLFAEDSHERFHWNYDSIPATSLGDQFMMHTVNAHFEFDFLRSRFHGGIDKLRRVGDRVKVPDTDRPFTIRLRALPLTMECIKRDHTMTFQGVAPCSGRKCAVLFFWTWLDVTSRSGAPPNLLERSGFTQFDGYLLVDLEDGSLHYGYFNEWVTLPTPGATGKELTRFYVEYEIERLARPVDPQQEDKPPAESDPSALAYTGRRDSADRSNPNSSEETILVTPARRRLPNIVRR